VLDGLAGLVERANVTKLDMLPVPLVDPPEWKALGSADVGAVRVDSTGAFAVEESAGPLDMRSAHTEQLGVMAANGLGLHIEDRQPINAARATSPPALQAIGMQDMEPTCLAIHRGVQRGDRVWAYGCQPGFATIESSALPYFSRSAGPIPETSSSSDSSLGRACTMPMSVRSVRIRNAGTRRFFASVVRHAQRRVS